ncbi:MAG: HipA domain-containing protein [Bacteroidales bacterium]
MNRCQITYEYLQEGSYSDEGLRRLSPKLMDLLPLEYSAEELRIEAANRASKMSIQGVQPKLVANLIVNMSKFEIVDKYGRYILKPQHSTFSQLPENEDLTMHLAKLAGIEVPTHGLIRGKDNKLTYFIQRFDRIGNNKKVAVEDFSQVAGLSRDTKYNYSMEKLVALIDEVCTFPSLEKARLFRRVVFNFLVGNEDMHLKNYSIINKKGKIELSPAYDFLNSTIVLSGEVEEIALTLKGKKSDIKRDDIIDYFGQERCGLTPKTVDSILNDIDVAIPEWYDFIDNSFLSEDMKEKYEKLLKDRIALLML